MSSPTLLPLLQATARAAPAVAALPDADNQALLLTLAGLLRAETPHILQANAADLDRMPRSDARWDRLQLTEARLAALADSLHAVAALPQPAGQLLLQRRLPNGLNLEKVSVPLGVVGVIYESRPNVTIDVAALCLRAGNAVVLRGGSDALSSNTFLVGLIHRALQQHGLPPAAVLLLPTDRQLLPELLTATRYVDVLIPRGSEQLIQFVRKNALIPTIETGAGVCHTYVHAEADLPKAAAIVINARVSRPSVCNSLDCLIMDTAIAADLVPLLVPELEKYGVEIYADAEACDLFRKNNYPHLHAASPDDFGREWLSLKMSVKTVAGPDEALAHIAEFSSRHSEAIVSENKMLCERFLREVDAAAVFANASTRFTDGGEFGLGAEIGISTQKLHARGPFALEKLVTEKWIVRGQGQIRI